MSDPAAKDRDVMTAPVGHLAVHLDDRHPQDVPFLFEQQQKRMGPALGFSIAWHGLIVLGLFLVMRYAPNAMVSQPMESIPFHDIVWLDRPGPGGGGGGGGNRMQAPPRKAELPGKD